MGVWGQCPQQALACAEGKGSELANSPCHRHGQKLVLILYSSVVLYGVIRRWERKFLSKRFPRSSKRQVFLLSSRPILAQGQYYISAFFSVQVAAASQPFAAASQPLSHSSHP